MAIEHIVSLIEKEISDEKETERLLEVGTLEELENFSHVVNPGFNRFRVIAKIAELEEKHA